MNRMGYSALKLLFNLKMKIFNLILLNFCFLQFFPLLLGMHPGGGPSGSQSGWPSGYQSGWINFGGDSRSQPWEMNQGAGPSGPQQPMNLDDHIRQLLQVNGNSRPHPEIIPRQLKNQGDMQGFGTIEKQYQNLDLAYNELETEFMAVNKEIRTQQDFGMYLPYNPMASNEYYTQINQRNTRLQEIQAEQEKIIEDKEKIQELLLQRQARRQRAERERQLAEHRQFEHQQSQQQPSERQQASTSARQRRLEIRRQRRAGNRGSGSGN